MKALALAYALLLCAPHVDPSSMARLITVESHGNPYALHDNATDTEYEPKSADEALALFQSLKADSARRCAIARAHDRYCLIDVGIAQVDESNFDVRDVASMLDPYVNIHRAAPLMLSAWDTAIGSSAHPKTWARYVALYGQPGLSPEQVVLRAAFSIYNSNSGYGNPDYVRRIEGAGSSTYVVETTRFADELRQQLTNTSDRCVHGAT